MFRVELLDEIQLKQKRLNYLCGLPILPTATKLNMVVKNMILFLDKRKPSHGMK